MVMQNFISSFEWTDFYGGCQECQSSSCSRRNQCSTALFGFEKKRLGFPSSCLCKLRAKISSCHTWIWFVWTHIFLSSRKERLQHDCPIKISRLKDGDRNACGLLAFQWLEIIRSTQDHALWIQHVFNTNSIKPKPTIRFKPTETETTAKSNNQ